MDAAAAGEGLEAVFQPIVSLPGGERVGFEALARWDHLGAGDAGDVFAHAARTGRAGALERKCIETAVIGALDAGLPPGSAVFINCEATTPYLSPADSRILAHGAERFQIVFEVTERSLLTHPPALLRKVVAMRRDGFAFALDDVGADLSSLALLDVLAPDVIKLDLALVQSQPHYRQARTWAAVLAHHEHAGAQVLAEGIETAEHLHRALALGATLGQGFRFGHPSPLSPGAGTGVLPPAIRTQSPCVDPGSPFAAVGGNPVLRRQRRDTVLALSLSLEQQALEAPDPPMVLAALQDARFFTGDTLTRYRRLATHSPLVAVFGCGLAEDLGCGIRGVRFAPGDSLERQWIVLALGANIAAALVSLEVTDPERASNGTERRFDVALTNDRTLVTKVARQLLTRMLTPPAPERSC
ncbi:sensor domain-containing phosphodiesterase [Mycobacterium sp. NPDC050041]|uniref:sensor domain-containing phosphodiesterase n=1 Tax=Mycobacterium sp. NPDC050041 TaxID=3364293 RepID=UPI003C303B83